MILADGFFEWGKGGNPSANQKQKQPFSIRLKSQRPFAFAGIWDEWKGRDGRKSDGDSIVSCAIITVEPNSLVRELHHRMPAILKKEDEGVWLSNKTSQEILLRELKPYPEIEMEIYPVSGKVGSTRYIENCAV